MGCQTRVSKVDEKLFAELQKAAKDVTEAQDKQKIIEEKIRHTATFPFLQEKGVAGVRCVAVTDDGYAILRLHDHSEEGEDEAQEIHLSI